MTDMEPIKDCYPNCMLRRGVGFLELSATGRMRMMGLINQSLAQGTCEGYNPATPEVCNNTRADSGYCLQDAAEKLLAAEEAIALVSKEIEARRTVTAIIRFATGM